LNIMAMRMGAFTFVPYVSALVDAQMRVPSMPQFGLLTDNYVGLGLGYARAFSKKAQFAVNLRPGFRIYKFINKSIGDFVPEDSIEGAQNEGDNDFNTLPTGTYLPIDLGFGYDATKDTR